MLNPTSANIPLSRLDVLKQTLYDVEESAKRSGELGLSRSVSNLRTQLTNKLDELSPKTPQGESVYKLAAFHRRKHLELIYKQIPLVAFWVTNRLACLLIVFLN